MKNVALVLLVEAILLAGYVGWQLGGCYLADYGLNDDMTGLAVQNRARAGLEAVSTEDELRSAVLASAKALCADGFLSGSDSFEIAIRMK